MTDRVSAPSAAWVSGACIGDFMMPGETAFARIPLFAYSIARDFVAEFRPPFVSDASTDGTPLIAWSVRLVVIVTTWPLEFFSISAIASCVIWKNPERFVAVMAA